MIACAAGPLTWAVADRERRGAEVAALGAMAAALLATVVTLVAVAVWNPGNASAGLLGWSLFACASALVVPVLTLVLLARNRAVDVPTSVQVLVRLTSACVFAIGWLVLAPGAASCLVWPIGLHIGAEAAVTAQFIGTARSARDEFLRFLVSPFHLGVLAGVVASNWLLRVYDFAPAAVEAAFALECTLLAIGLAFATLTKTAAAELQVIEQARLAERSSERRRRAHWIHDDVCADIRSVKIKLATQEMTSAEIAGELDELDHQLRVRQLDEVLAGGLVSAAEIIQPYLRKAQNQGVHLVEVPRHEAASIQVGAASADLLRRAISGLIANAVAAGCTKLAIRLQHRPGVLSLSVEDDAGGFDHHDLPAGRGLSTLWHDLGPESVVVAHGPEGALVTVDVGLGAGGAP